MNYEWEIFINKKCCQNYENTVKSSNFLNFFSQWTGLESLLATSGPRALCSDTPGLDRYPII